MSFVQRIRLLPLLLFIALTIAVNNVRCDDPTEDNSDVQESGRTFGHHFLKRLSFAMIPIMYKLGMMTTLLITLTIMSTKGLAVGVLLLVLAISQIIARGYGTTAAIASSPAVYPVQVHAQVPVVHKTVPALPVQAAYAYQPYAGWHGKELHSPYAREDTEETEYVKA